MRNKFIAVAAIAFAPAFALAQGGGGGTGGAGGTGGNGGTGAGATGGNAGTSTGGVSGATGATGTTGAAGGGVSGGATGGVHGGVSGGVNGGVNGTDTTVRRDTGSTVGGAGGVSSTGAAADTGTSRDTSTVQSSAEGRLYTKNRSHGRNLGLTPDQVKQLQTAINDAGCNAGNPDGVVGRRTRQGIACVRKQKGITGKNLDDVLSALNLGFTTQTTTTESGGEVVGGGTGNVKGTAKDTSGNAGRIRPPADSTRSEPMTHESTRGAQRGGGMHDSTTSRTGAASDSTGMNMSGDSSMNMSRDTSMSGSRDTSLTGSSRDSLSRDSLSRDSSRTTSPPLNRDTTGAGMSHDSSHTRMGNDSTPPGTARDTSRAPR